MDTYPPVIYLNDTSHYIIQLITIYNSLHSSPKVAYTFDAGPNAVLFAPEGNIGEILGLIQHYLPPLPGQEQWVYK